MRKGLNGHPFRQAAIRPGSLSFASATREYRDGTQPLFYPSRARDIVLVLLVVTVEVPSSVFL